LEGSEGRERRGLIYLMPWEEELKKQLGESKQNDPVFLGLDWICQVLGAGNTREEKRRME